MKPIEDYANAAALLWCHGTTLHEACAQVMAEMLKDTAEHVEALLSICGHKAEVGQAVRMELDRIAAGGSPFDWPVRDESGALSQGDGHA